MIFLLNWVIFRFQPLIDLSIRGMAAISERQDLSGGGGKI